MAPLRSVLDAPGCTTLSGVSPTGGGLSVSIATAVASSNLDVCPEDPKATAAAPGEVEFAAGAVGAGLMGVAASDGDVETPAETFFPLA